jgi:ABC-type multidrug transport system ATPase subunit
MSSVNQTCPKCGASNPSAAGFCNRCGTALPNAANEEVHGTVALELSQLGGQLITVFVALDGASGRPTVRPLVEPLLTMGNSSEHELPLITPGIDVYHARLKQEALSYRLYNLSADHRVLVNDEVVADSRTLHDGDIIRLEDNNHRGATVTFNNPTEPSRPPRPVGQTIELQPLPFTIGRDPESSLAIDVLAASWHHATITMQGTAHILLDMNSTNGTFVNDHPIKAQHRLHNGDTIRIGTALMVYQGNSLQFLPTQQEFQLDARGLAMTYTTGSIKKRTLNTMREVSLSIKPKEFVAVIGGSGSGKSTLLRSLNGAQRATTGQVLINGNDLYRDYAQYQPLIGYVPQADIVHDGLSVYQSLWYSARLRFPGEPETARQQRIDRALDALELTPFKDRLVGRLSGGQKKRVSIALEMMAEPPLLFMDEPSSGLDEGLDKSMMNTLRKLADRGHIVTIVTHTTLNIDLCDELVLMSRGNLVYYGPPHESLNFFGVRAYSEVYDKVLQAPDSAPQTTRDGTLLMSQSDLVAQRRIDAEAEDQYGRQWAARFQQTPIYQEYVADRLKESTAELSANEAPQLLRGKRRGTFWQQTRVLTERTLALTRRDVRTLALLLLVLPLIGLFLAVLHFDHTFGVRGQMLVHLDTKVFNVNDKLPATVISLCAQTPPPVECTLPGNGTSKTVIQSIAGFSPANDAQRLLFMMSLAVTLLGVFASAYTIVVEKSLFLRERMVNLRIAPYLASKVIVYGGLAVLSAALLLIIIALGVQLPEHGVFTWGPLELFITLALTAFTGVSIGLLLSALNRQVNAVTYLMLGVLFIQILFPGVLFKMEGALEPLSRLTITRWSLEALGATANMVARDQESITILHTRLIGPNLDGIKLLPGPSALNVTYPTDAAGLFLRWGVLLVFAVIFLGASALALRRNDSL